MNPMEDIKNPIIHTTDIKMNAAQTKTLTNCRTNIKQLPAFLNANIRSFANSSKKDKSVEIEVILI